MKYVPAFLALLALVGLAIAEVSIDDDLRLGNGQTINAIGAMTVTNGEVVTCSTRFCHITPIGAPDDGTNTVTLADPAIAGTVYTFYVPNSATNTLEIDRGDNGTWAANKSIKIKPGGSRSLYAPDTNTWARHNNKKGG